MRKKVITILLAIICCISSILIPSTAGASDIEFSTDYFVCFKPQFSSYGKDQADFLKKQYPEMKFYSIQEETYYYDMWNPTEQEKYIYANWANATNYLGTGFRQIYHVRFAASTFYYQDEWLNNDYFVYSSFNPLAENQIPHTELVAFTCGDLDDDGQTTSQDALIILQSIVGLEQLDQYEYALADADFNFTVDSLDALEVLKISVGETAQPF